MQVNDRGLILIVLSRAVPAKYIYVIKIPAALVR